MTRNLLFAAMAVFLLSVTASAQSSRATDKTVTKYQPTRSIVSKKPSQTPDQLKDEPIWADDFSEFGGDDPTTFANWTVENDSDPDSDWLRSEDPSAIPNAGLSPMASTSVDNGYALIDSDSQGESASQDAYLIMATPVDLSGVSNVSVTFEQNTRNWATEYYMRLSPDNGATWIELAINEEITTNVSTGNPEFTSIDVSEVLGGSSEALVAFRFVATWGWHWAIDDFAIINTPENDLAFSAAYYDDYFLIGDQDEYLDSDYLAALEFSSYSQGEVRPLTFVAEVVNAGAAEQTGVVMQAEVTTPNGTETFNSDPITVAPGETAYMTIADITLDAFSGGGAVGDYSVMISVAQNEEDEIPSNNEPIMKSFSVNSDGVNINDNTDWNTTYNGTDGALAQDVIWANRMVFAEDREINMIQFGVLDWEAQGFSSTPGDELFLNITTGSVLETASEDNVMTRHFGDEDGLSYIIQAEDLSTVDETVWINYMIDEGSEVAVAGGQVVQGEVQVPPNGEPYMWIPFSNNQEATCGVLYEFADLSGGPQGWWTLGGNLPHVRLMFNAPVGVNEPSDLTFKLGQNYPNPSMGQTFIAWELLEPAKNVQFRITDITGKTVYQKDLGDRPAGVQETLELNLNLAAGQYQYSMRIDNNVIVRKMMISK